MSKTKLMPQATPLGASLTTIALTFPGSGLVSVARTKAEIVPEWVLQRHWFYGLLAYSEVKEQRCRTPSVSHSEKTRTREPLGWPNSLFKSALGLSMY